MASFQGFFGRVAADQSGGAGDEDRFHRLRVHALAHSREGRPVRLRRPSYRIEPKSEIGVVFKSSIGVGFIVRRCSD